MMSIKWVATSGVLAMALGGYTGYDATTRAWDVFPASILGMIAVSMLFFAFLHLFPVRKAS